MPRKEYHWGRVTDNDDPEKRGRLTIECPTIVAEDVLDWIEPSFFFTDTQHNAGSFWVPNVGTFVEVEIEAEEDSEVQGLEPKWKCCIYPDGTVPEVFETNYPNRRGWVTRAGHVFYFDDTEDQRTFYYEHPSGTTIKVVENGNIELSPASGQSVLVGDGADQPFVRGQKLYDYLTVLGVGSGLVPWAANHVHPDPVSGQTGIPTVAPPPPGTDILSDDHKVK